MDFNSINLNEAILTGANLQGANLMHTKLRDAHLEAADLSGADLRYSHLNNANLTGANLERANLAGAHLDDAILENANLFYCKPKRCNNAGWQEIQTRNSLHRSAYRPKTNKLIYPKQRTFGQRHTHGRETFVRADLPTERGN